MGIGRDEGNINLDFLVGLVVFMAAFLYVINAVPGMFLPYQTNIVDLGSVIYRTSCILAEDPGWYDDPSTGVSYTDWEDGYHIAHVTRVGLAVDKRAPNVLSQRKIDGLKGLPYILSRDKLGLNNTVAYNYSLVIRKISPGGTAGEELLNITNPATSGNVDSLERAVLIRESEGLLIDCNEVSGIKVNNLSLSKSPRFDDWNVSVTILNFTSNPLYNENLSVVYYPGPYYGNFSFAMPASYTDHEFYIFKNKDYVTDWVNEPYDRDDVVEVVIDARKIGAKCMSLYGFNVSHMEIVSNNAFCFSEDVQDYNLTNPNYRYFNGQGTISLKVWQC